MSFWLAAAFLVYTLAGYPILLGWLARRRARPVHRASIQPAVSIVMAVYNGEQFIREKIESILDLDYPPERMDILVASDGSEDRTNEIVAEFAGRVRLLALPHAGKPSALTAAMAVARGDILVFTDVRQRLANDSLRLLVENFADPAVGVASGRLVILSGTGREEADVGLYWRYEIRLRLRLSEIDSIFGATGAYYGVRRELAVPIPARMLLDDMYLPLAAFFRGFRLIVDDRVRMFDFPTGIESEFRRKVRTLAGNYQILRAYPHLLTHKNRMWWHFVSYKLARLLLPFALIAVALGSFGLPAPLRQAAFLSQGLFYGAGVADLWIPETFIGKRITSPIRAFLSLMAAALVATIAVFVPAERLWQPGLVRGSSKAADERHPA